MEKLRTLRAVVWMCVAILAAQLAALVAMLPAVKIHVWIGLGVVAVLCLYVTRISLGLIKELEDKEEEIERLKKNK